MQIGFLAPDLTLAHGWGMYTLSLIRALHRAGLNTTVVTARNSPPVDDIPFLPLLPDLAPAQSLSLPRMLACVPAVRRYLANCEVIHSTVERYAPLAALTRGSRPAFVTAHGSYVYLPKIRRFPVNLLYRWAFLQCTVVCVSRYTARIAEQVVPGVHTVVINNAVEAERFRINSSAGATHVLPRPDNRPVILTTGSVKSRKGTLELVRAVAKVREHIPDVLCVIAGTLEHEPLYVDQVRETITRLNLADSVRLTGKLSDEELRAWYARASVFVMPSINDGWRFEGFGLVHLEASAAGLPVIGTTDCGAEDAIEHGVTGLLVDQARIDDLLPGAILEILLHPAKAKQMGEAGRAKAQHQTWDSVAAQMIQVYQAGHQA